MMKKVLFALVCLASGTVVMAQSHDGHDHGTPAAATVVAATPSVEILSVEPEHNFGKIPQGKPVTYNFEVKNTGTQAFKLDNVQASCGCTTPEWDREAVIAPGATAKIKVGYNAAAEGPFNKAVTITYNTNQTKVINIKGEVWKTPAASAPANDAAGDLKN